MADRKKVANQDGPFKTNRVNVEAGYSLAPGYDLLAFEQQEIGATGRLKVLRVFPLDKQAADPCFLGRWDEPANTLDFDLVEGAEDHVQPVRLHGHHSTALGDRRFEVELGSDADNIVFKGIVSIALGFRMRLGDALAVAELKCEAELVRGSVTEADGGAVALCPGHDQ